jgi:hypothetical protein
MLVREVQIPQRAPIGVWLSWSSWLVVAVLCFGVVLQSVRTGPRCKKSEEALQLSRIGKHAKTHFIEKQAFPVGRSQTMPPWSCCPGRCGVVPRQAWAADPIWGALDFSIDRASQVRYTYESVDGQTFRVTAVRDAKCNGVLSTYVLEGSHSNGNPSVTLIEPVPAL